MSVVLRSLWLLLPQSKATLPTQVASSQMKPEVRAPGPAQCSDSELDTPNHFSGPRFPHWDERDANRDELEDYCKFSLECIDGGQGEYYWSLNKKKRKESFALVGQTLGTLEGIGPSSSPCGESCKRLLQTLSPHCVSDTGLHLLLGTAEPGPVIPPGGSVLSLTASQRHLRGLGGQGQDCQLLMAGPGFSPNPALEPLLQSVL